MEGKDIREEQDLKLAKEFLNNMLAPLSEEERKDMLQLLLYITKDM